MKQLPPLPKESYDGEKYEAPIHKDRSLTKSCLHKAVTLIDSHHLKCECGAGWTGFGVHELYKAFKNQP
jgi:hypothetical protein